jgi:hypothetical protein
VHGQKKYDSRAYSRDPAVKSAFLKEQTEDVKNNAEFVFEGFYQKSDVYPRKDKNGKEYYPICNIIKITKVFRGNLKPGTVEIAAVQNKYSDFTPPLKRESELYSDSTKKLIFFCRAAGKDHPYDATYDIYPVDNKTILMKANEYVESGFRMPVDYMFETRMYMKGDVYRYIRKLPNIKMPVLTKEDTVEVSNHKAIPGKPVGLTKIEKDSLKAIRIEKRRTDSIEHVRADSIALLKKVKPLTLRDAFLKEQTEDVKNNAEFVFEGFFQRRDIYPRKDKNGKLYYPLCDLVKITKVFRGNLKPGTVEITAVKDLNEFIPPSERESYIPVSTKLIFFCRAAGKDHPYDATYDIYPVDNKTILMRASESVRSIFDIPDYNMLGTKMYTESDVYRYIRKLPNVKMPKLTEEDTVYVNPWKAVPAESRMSQVEIDSMNIRLAKRRLVLHRADSIRRVKADSIEFVKKNKAVDKP